MVKGKPVISTIGIVLGGIALMLALIHFYAGPFSPQLSLEDSIADKAVAIRDATMAALKGEEREVELVATPFDYDQAVQIAISIMGGLAVILGVAGFATEERMRGGIGAVILGVFAVGFQFMGIALGMILLAILIGTVLSQLGFG